MNRPAFQQTCVFVVLSIALVFSITLQATEAREVPSVIPIDIKPGSDTNPLNVHSRGVLPVAIFGSDIDVTRILMDTVTIGIEGGDQVGWSRWSYQDIDEDGNPDLLIKFRTTVLVSRLGLKQEEHGTTVLLTLSGSLAGPGGSSFTGLDSILIVNRKK